VLRAYCDLEREATPAELPLPFGHGECPKFVCHRYFWDVCNDRPLVSDLVVHLGDAFEPKTIWAGAAALTFFDAENEEVLPFQPRRVLGGWCFTKSFHHGTSPPVVIHDFLDSEKGA
jgi:hypothetical protein